MLKLAHRKFSFLLYPKELNNNLRNFRILDATLSQGNNPKLEYEKAHIPGAQFMGMSENFFDFNNPVPMMICSEQQFQTQMERLDIRKSDKVVVYDTNNMLGACRAFWMFQVFQVDVMILNCPFKQWISRGYRTTTEPPAKREPAKEDYNFKKDNSKIFTFDNITQNDKPILDTRFKQNYEAGHIPGSTNFPFPLLFDENGCFKTDLEFKLALEERANLSEPSKQPVIASCQSGITACTLYVALSQLGNKNVQVYDGSYSEYKMKQI